MKFALGGMLTGLFVILLLPAIIVHGLGSFKSGSFFHPFLGQKEDLTVKLYRADKHKVIEVSLEDYVVGVVAAEMPVEFEIDALAAQAVAARTYVIRTLKNFGGQGSSEHPGADISSDYREGQAWISEEERKEKWGGRYTEYEQKIVQAVSLTRGIILTYEGKPIHAVFHSTAGPKTASAKEVWGSDYPYLVSVANEWDQQSPRYQEDRECTLAQLQECLGVETGILAAIKRQGGAALSAKVLSRTDSGRVDQIRIGDKTVSGQEVRDKLGLKSTNFTVETKADRLVFHTTGYGHGVGMSQYGANGMAKAGYDYKRILTYYYTGVTLTNLQGF